MNRFASSQISNCREEEEREKKIPCFDFCLHRFDRQMATACLRSRTMRRTIAQIFWWKAINIERQQLDQTRTTSQNSIVRFLIMNFITKNIPPSSFISLALFSTEQKLRKKIRQKNPVFLSFLEIFVSLILWNTNRDSSLNKPQKKKILHFDDLNFKLFWSDEWLTMTTMYAF